MIRETTIKHTHTVSMRTSQGNTRSPSPRKLRQEQVIWREDNWMFKYIHSSLLFHMNSPVL